MVHPIVPKANPKHSFEKAGDYLVSVTIVGPKGGSDFDEFDIIVEEE